MTPTIHKLNDMSVWAVWVETPVYDEDYITELKQLVKPRHRRWDADRRVWLFKSIAVELVTLLLQRHFGGFQWAEDAPSTALASVEQAYSTLYLLPSAPASLVKVAYKHLAKELHPDKGGDLRRMQAINVAYELIERCA